MSKGELVKGNWRTAYGYRFLSSDDFEDGQEITLTIKTVTREEAHDLQTKQETTLLSVGFDETDRLLALNATNAKTIASRAGSPMVDRWAGTKITLHTKSIKAFGKQQLAVRVK